MIEQHCGGFGLGLSNLLIDDYRRVFPSAQPIAAFVHGGCELHGDLQIVFNGERAVFGAVGRPNNAFQRCSGFNSGKPTLFGNSRNSRVPV